MFPSMATDELMEMRKRYEKQIYGCKLTGAGGGGYLIMVSDEPVEHALKIIPSAI